MINPSSARLLATKALEETGTHIYIMLGDSADREENIQQLLNNMGLDKDAIEKHVTIIRAVTVPQMKNLTLRSEFIASTQGVVTDEYIEKALFYSAFQLCCFLTHIKTWLVFQNTPHLTNALIFEDDANIADTNELQLLHKFPGLSTYPTEGSKVFKGFSEHDKQMILFDKMLRLPPSQWDIQYLGFCYDCGNVRRHPIHAAKVYYLNNGIDAFLIQDQGQGQGQGQGQPAAAAAEHKDTVTTAVGTGTGTGIGSDVDVSFRPGAVLTPTEEVELARRYFYYGHIKPLCLHSYVINKKLVGKLLTLRGGLRFWDPPHWASDAYVPNIVCRYKLKMLRSIVPIFNQNGKGGAVSYLKHTYDKPAESKGSCEEATKQCHKLHLNQTEMDRQQGFQ